jgi:hypothetical protein
MTRRNSIEYTNDYKIVIIAALNLISNFFKYKSKYHYLLFLINVLICLILLFVLGYNETLP